MAVNIKQIVTFQLKALRIAGFIEYMQQVVNLMRAFRNTGEDGQSALPPKVEAVSTSCRRPARRTRSPRSPENQETPRSPSPDKLLSKELILTGTCPLSGFSLPYETRKTYQRLSGSGMENNCIILM